jgi:recombination protein RecA
MQSAILRAQLESALGERIAAPFTDLDKRACETVPTGIAELDSRIGGLRRGSITEIYGLPSTGKTSMLLSILAAATAREETCVLVDGTDAFSPHSGAIAGIELTRFLWVRCHNLDQTLKVTDLLLQSGGFGVVALDLSDLPVETIQSVPLTTWFRFQRSIEKTPTILAIISSEGVAKTCAALAIKTGEADCRLRIANSTLKTIPSHSALFQVLSPVVGIVRNRNRQFSTDLKSHVRFDLHPSFSRPGACP